MNSEQLVKSENINFENIKFNAVSKDLKFTNIEEGPEVELLARRARSASNSSKSDKAWAWMISVQFESDEAV